MNKSLINAMAGNLKVGAAHVMRLDEKLIRRTNTSRAAEFTSTPDFANPVTTRHPSFPAIMPVDQ